jgi:hypothetical protein
VWEIGLLLLGNEITFLFFGRKGSKLAESETDRCLAFIAEL